MKGSSSSRWGRCLRAPLRALCSVRDLYVKGMNGCAGRVQFRAAATGYPSFSEFAFGYPFSRSSGRSSASEEDLRELIRAASVRAAAAGPVRRSQSVVVGRIDEDAPSEFDAEVGSYLLFPRSRSYAAAGAAAAAVGVKRRRVKVLA